MAPRITPRVVALAAALLLAGCGAGGPGGSAEPTASTLTSAEGRSDPTSPSARPETSAEPTPQGTCGQRLAARMGPRQRAGQLLMVGLSTGQSVEALAAQVREQGLGGVVYLGTWSGRDLVASASGELQQAAGDAGLLVAADQEGGRVQRLVGPGFSTIPSAREQATLGHRELARRVERWSGELAEAGINLNLAPVADTVPSGVGAENAPIGALSRDFVPGSPRGNGGYVAAFVRGSLATGVAPTLKHFPGLGRVTGNTDHTSTGITDPTTSEDDRYLWPFRVGIRAGAPVVMLSSAVYTRIDDSRPAMFSAPVVTGVLRERLGFDGVAISDDVGAAQAVASVPVGERATRFIAAGGDVVLTAAPSQTREMLDAIEAGMTAPAFARKVDAAAARVLDLKASLDLVSC